MAKVNQSLNIQFRENQRKKFDDGKIVKYKDGNEYLVSPGFTAVNLSVFKASCKSIGMSI